MSYEANELDEKLKKFFAEVRKKDGLDNNNNFFWPLHLTEIKLTWNKN